MKSSTTVATAANVATDDKRDDLYARVDSWLNKACVSEDKAVANNEPYEN